MNSFQIVPITYLATAFCPFYLIKQEPNTQLAPLAGQHEEAGKHLSMQQTISIDLSLLSLCIYQMTPDPVCALSWEVTRAMEAEGKQRD